jgi:hypothetical protein
MRGVVPIVVGLAVLLFAGAPAAAGVDLTQGASTFVPASMNPDVTDAFGEPYVVRTRVTGVRFHNGTIPSTAPGGLVDVPHPVAKRQHGVRYYQVTGELSGVGHDPAGFEYVYGPIAGDGTDHSGRPGDPRQGLPGIPFRLVYPASGWNGRLIVFRPGGDGGLGSGHYLYQTVTDELELVRRGYAYFVTLGGGTTPVDSNPDSVSRLFWQLAPPFWAVSGNPHPENFRVARIDPDSSEHLIPGSEAGSVWFPDDPAPTPISSETTLTGFISWGIVDDVPTLRDHIAFAKNLVGLLLGSRPAQTGMLSWSRSGALALGMEFGRTMQYPPAAVRPAFVKPELYRALTPRTGGDFVRPYDPSSGRVADWFVDRSGIELAYFVEEDGTPEFFDPLPDPDYPVAAPLIYLSGEVDIQEGQIVPYLLASLISEALPGSKLKDKNINSWLRIYSLRGATHYPLEAWFAGPANGGNATWYDPAAGVNHDGRGLEFPAWADSVIAPDPGFFDPELTGLWESGLLREEGFSLQAILNADRWARTGVAPPTSVADGSLVTNPSPATVNPVYPVADACTPDAIFGALDSSCLSTLTQDSFINDPGSIFQFDDFLTFLMQEFAASGLRYTTTPIDLPDEAAPLGFRLLTRGPALRGTFTTAELRARYHTHAGYVAAVARSVARLVARGLYDPLIGAADIAAAARSDVLR